MTDPKTPTNVTSIGSRRGVIVRAPRQSLNAHRFRVRVGSRSGPVLDWVLGVAFDRHARVVELVSSYGRELTPRGLVVAETLLDRLLPAVITAGTNTLAVMLLDADAPDEGAEEVACVEVHFERATSDHGTLDALTDEFFAEIVTLHDATIGDLEWLTPAAELAEPTPLRPA